MSFRLTRPYVRSWGPGEKCSCEVGLAKIAHKSAAAKSETPVDANLNCARCVRNRALVARGRMGSVDLDKVAGEKGLANPTSQVQEACDDAVDIDKKLQQVLALRCRPVEEEVSTTKAHVEDSCGRFVWKRSATRAEIALELQRAHTRAESRTRAMGTA